MKIDEFGKGSTFQEVADRRKRMKDSQAGELLDKMLYGDTPLSVKEKEDLYYLFVKEIGMNRLRRFLSDNCFELTIGLFLALACMVVLVTGYDANLVLFYLSCAVNLILFFFTLSKSFKNLESWLIRVVKEKMSE